MANVLTILNIGREAPGQLRVRGTIALSGSYVATPTGEILDFSKAVLPAGASLPVSKQPTSMDVWGTIGLTYEPIGPLGGAGLTVPMKIVAATVSGTTPTVNELGAGAYNALITADKIQFEATFDYGL